MQWLVGWLVGWFGDQGKKGLRWQRSALCPRGLYSFNLTAAVQHSPQDSGFSGLWVPGPQVPGPQVPGPQVPGPVFIVFLEQMSL